MRFLSVMPNLYVADVEVSVAFYRDLLGGTETFRAPASGDSTHVEIRVGDVLIEPGVLLAWTIRRDGTARISGVEPLVLDGDLWLSMMSGSAKSRDLHRDPRVMLNSVITSPSPRPRSRSAARSAR